jgi:hypothetical protein
VQPNRVIATALFRVDSTKPAILSDGVARRNPAQDFELVKKTQIALVRSSFVLQAAARKPGIATLPVFAQGDPVDWLEKHLVADFPENGEILAISLRGPESHSGDLVRIVDAVAKAYQDEVIYSEKQRRLNDRDMLARNLEKLNQEIAQKMEEFSDIARESGRTESGSGQVLQQIDLKRLDRIETELLRLESKQLELETSGESGNPKFFEQRIDQLRERQAELEKRIASRSENSVELTLRQREFERLQRVADEMSVQLEELDIQSQAPDRIQLVQPAVASPVD